MTIPPHEGLGILKAVNPSGSLSYPQTMAKIRLWAAEDPMAAKVTLIIYMSNYNK